MDTLSVTIPYREHTLSLVSTKHFLSNDLLIARFEDSVNNDAGIHKKLFGKVVYKLPCSFSDGVLVSKGGHDFFRVLSDARLAEINNILSDKFGGPIVLLHCIRHINVNQGWFIIVEDDASTKQFEIEEFIRMLSRCGAPYGWGYCPTLDRWFMCITHSSHDIISPLILNPSGKIVGLTAFHNLRAIIYSLEEKEWTQLHDPIPIRIPTYSERILPPLVDCIIVNDAIPYNHLFLQLLCLTGSAVYQKRGDEYHAFTVIGVNQTEEEEFNALFGSPTLVEDRESEPEWTEEYMSQLTQQCLVSARQVGDYPMDLVGSCCLYHMLTHVINQLNTLGNTLGVEIVEEHFDKLIEHGLTGCESEASKGDSEPPLSPEVMSQVGDDGWEEKSLQTSKPIFGLEDREASIPVENSFSCLDEVEA